MFFDDVLDPTGIQCMEFWNILQKYPILWIKVWNDMTVSNQLQFSFLGDLSFYVKEELEH